MERSPSTVLHTYILCVPNIYGLEQAVSTSSTWVATVTTVAATAETNWKHEIENMNSSQNGALVSARTEMS